MSVEQRLDELKTQNSVLDRILTTLIRVMPEDTKRKLKTEIQEYINLEGLDHTYESWLTETLSRAGIQIDE